VKRKPTIAICYDFDGTLSPGNMQEYGFFDGLSPSERRNFWKESYDLARSNGADPILTYMLYMLSKADDCKLKTTKKAFKDYGSTVELHQGVETWFSRVNKFGEKLGMKIEHYIVSSGLREMIKGTSIAREFEEIFACSYFYDQNGVAKWPAQAINYTTKTQFLFRINKGIKDITDDKKINEYVRPQDRAVPFSRMIYIGDGATDIPCMKLVKDQGGFSIAVYGPKKISKKKVSERLLNEGRVNFCLPADYSEGKRLERVVFAMIKKMASEYELMEQGCRLVREQAEPHVLESGVREMVDDEASRLRGVSENHRP